LGCGGRFSCETLHNSTPLVEIRFMSEDAEMAAA
jgi:hypothetical protein